MDKFNSDIIAVTNRHVCRQSYDDHNLPYSFPTEPLLKQIRQLCLTNVEFIILREKDLPETEYLELAKSAFDICSNYDKRIILHTYINIAETLNYRHIHLPLHILENGCANKVNFSCYKTIGVSVHSKDEAVLAESLGATYITAGHIFDTECKKGLPGRGLPFLQEVCSAVKIPVYAIGGITPDNLASVLDAGARGGCMMSGVMRV